MSDVKAIFSARLSAARIMCGMSRETLSEKIGKSRQSVYKYEKGEMLPDSTSLIQIARALGIPVDYLFRTFTVSVENIEFRKKSKLRKKNENAIKERVKDWLEKYIEIENTCSISSNQSINKVEVINEKDIYAVVDKMRGEWKLGDDGISSVVEVLEENNIKVIELPEDVSFDGLSGYIGNGVPFIVINSAFKSERKRFTALHELGHIILSFPKDFNNKRIEKCCNLFANEMLIPQNIYKQKIGENRSDISLRELIDIQRQFGISIDALMYKACYLNIITERRYTAFCKKKNALPQFKLQVEKDRTADERPVRFERLVFRALADERISLSKASVLLGRPISEVRNELALV